MTNRNNNQFSEERISILVVDDSQDSALTLADLLSMDGYDVRVAFNGKDAIKRVKEGVPQAIIFDVVMPEMDGAELAEVLHADFPRDIVLVAMTGMGDGSERAQVAINLADHFLRKPVDYAVLRNLLDPEAA